MVNKMFQDGSDKILNLILYSISKKKKYLLIFNFVFTVKQQKARKSKSPVSRHLKSASKISETSLFADLVRDRNRREAEAKLAATKGKEDERVKKQTDLNPVATLDIPFPVNEADCSSSSSVPQVNAEEKSFDKPKLNAVSERVSIEMELDEGVEAGSIQEGAEPGSMPSPPRNTFIGLEVKKGSLGESLLLQRHGTLLNKLPLPPGMKTTDLESIDSPPSRSPSPAQTPAKGKPKKGIRDLPLPPGRI